MSLAIYEARGRKTQYWGFSSGVAEDSMIWSMKVLDGHSDPWIWRQLHIFKMLWSDYPMMHGHVLEEQNPQQRDASSVMDRNMNQCFVQSVPTVICSNVIYVVKLWIRCRWWKSVMTLETWGSVTGTVITCSQKTVSCWSYVSCASDKAGTCI
jgi:hypothetical protein